MSPSSIIDIKTHNELHQSIHFSSSVPLRLSCCSWSVIMLHSCSCLKGWFRFFKIMVHHVGLKETVSCTNQCSICSLHILLLFHSSNCGSCAVDCGAVMYDHTLMGQSQCSLTSDVSYQNLQNTDIFLLFVCELNLNECPCLGGHLHVWTHDFLFIPHFCFYLVQNHIFFKVGSRIIWCYAAGEEECLREPVK